MKKHNFKPKEIKTRGVIPGIMTICATCKKGMWEGHHKEWLKTFGDAQQHNENHPIKKLQPYRKYKIPALNIKINQIIEWINQHEK